MRNQVWILSSPIKDLCVVVHTPRTGKAKQEDPRGLLDSLSEFANLSKDKVKPGMADHV